MATGETASTLFLEGKEAFRHQNFQEALNAFSRAAELEPDGESVHWRQMILDILEFHDKERYNP